MELLSNFVVLFLMCSDQKVLLLLKAATNMSIRRKLNVTGDKCHNADELFVPSGLRHRTSPLKVMNCCRLFQLMIPGW